MGPASMRVNGSVVSCTAHAGMLLRSMPDTASRFSSFGQVRDSPAGLSAVEVDQQPVAGSALERRPVQVHDLFGLVVEEVDLYPNGADVLHVGEERLPGVRIVNLLAVLPQPDPDAVPPRVLDQLPQLGIWLWQHSK